MDSRERSYLESFRKVLKAVTSTLSLDEVLDMLVRNVAEVMNVKACTIRLLDPEKGTLELMASYGLSNNYIQKGHIEAQRSIAESMEGKTVTVLNMAEDPRAQYPKAAVEEGIVSLCSIPLSIKGRVIGVLRVYTGAPHNFTEDEINFAEALAEMGAIAIRNARVHEGLQGDFQRVVDMWSAELNR
ncbi:MAG: GAF domain-containing protein [Deltaproteobacteria bacterium]|jgi:signal transduction protein with GAF and PtsI domain|nr:GAF domain-containing protein [Deltaproteobacteria bacterium]